MKLVLAISDQIKSKISINIPTVVFKQAWKTAAIPRIFQSTTESSTINILAAPVFVSPPTAPETISNASHITARGIPTPVPAAASFVITLEI